MLELTKLPTFVLAAFVVIYYFSFFIKVLDREEKTRIQREKC